MANLAGAVTIIALWLAFPFFMSMVYSNCYEGVNLGYYSSISEPTGWDYFSGAFSFIRVIFQVMFIGIPCAPSYIILITWIINITTGLLLYLFLRGTA